MRFPLRPYIAHMQAQQQQQQQRSKEGHEGAAPAPFSPYVGPTVHHMTLLDGEMVQDKMEEGKVTAMATAQSDFARA